MADSDSAIVSIVRVQCQLGDGPDGAFLLLNAGGGEFVRCELGLDSLALVRDLTGDEQLEVLGKSDAAWVVLAKP